MSDWFKKDGLCTTSTFIVPSKRVFLIWLERWERIYWKGSVRKYRKTWCRVYKKDKRGKRGLIGKDRRNHIDHNFPC